MELLGLSIIQGISYGMLLFLIASGFSLIFGVVGILNLAHGAFYMYGAFLGLTAATMGEFGMVGSTGALGGNWLLGLLAGGIGVMLIGLIVERVFLSRLHGLFNEQTLLTVGLVYIFANVAVWIWKGGPKIGAAPSFLDGSIAIGAGSIDVYRLTLIPVGLGIFALLWWFQDKTRAGAIIRAGMDDKQMTMGLGINYMLVCTAVFMLGSLLGGLAGFLGMPIIGAYDAMSWDILIYAVAVVIVGGLGSVQGTLVGALLIGIIDTLGKTYVPELAMYIPYLVIIIALLLRPQGLVARK